MSIGRVLLLCWLLGIAALLAAGCDDDDAFPGAGVTRPPEPGVDPAVVDLVPDAATYSVGDTVSVVVTIRNAVNVGSIPFHLFFDPDVIDFVPPATEGPFLGSDGAQTVFLAGEIGGGGEIVVGYSRLGAMTGASGAGRIATFEFTATNPGPCAFFFSGAFVKDPQARNLLAEFRSASIRVEP